MRQETVDCRLSIVLVYKWDRARGGGDYERVVVYGRSNPRVDTPPHFGFPLHFVLTLTRMKAAAAHNSRILIIQCINRSH